MKRPSLANAELAVMDLLWQNERLTARQIREQLYPDTSKTQHGTVQRLLQRLEDKRYVERDRSLFVHLFSAAISRQTYAGQQLESLADKLTAGSFAPLITHLVEQKKISRDEINRIRAILGGAQMRSPRMMPCILLSAFLPILAALGQEHKKGEAGKQSDNRLGGVCDLRRPSNTAVRATDVTLHVRTAGNAQSGNVLIAINGGPGQSSRYMRSLEQLASSKFAVVTYDQRGTGRSTVPSDGYGLLKYVADVEAVRKAVGAKKVYVLGHSWGGIVAMRYATVHPQRVRSIILMGSGPPSRLATQAGQANLTQRIAELQRKGIIPSEFSTNPAEVLEAILPAYFSDPRFKIPDELKETPYNATVYQQTLSALGDWDFTSEVAKLDHHVLMLWGNDDPFGLPMAEATKKALSEAEVKLVVLKACGHYWHETPDAFFSHVRAFLKLPSAEVNGLTRDRISQTGDSHLFTMTEMGHCP